MAVTVKATNDLKIARGTARKDRASKASSVIAGRPVKPGWLGERASEKWDETILLLEAESQCSPTYGDFLAMYCHAHQEFYDASRVIEDEGAYVHSEKGGVYQHPAVGVRNQAIDRIMKFGRQLGLSAQSIKFVQKTEKQDTTSTKKRFFG